MTRTKDPSDNLFELDLQEMDALREVGSIAAAYAATALSEIVGENVYMDVPEVHVHEVAQLPLSLGRADGKIAAIFMEVRPPRPGSILILFPYERFLGFSSRFLHRSAEVSLEDPACVDAILEIGNILACSYLNALSKVLATTLVPSPPRLATGTLDEVLAAPEAAVARQSKYAVVVRAEFAQGKNRFPGTVAFMPDPRTEQTILTRFGYTQSLKRVTPPGGGGT